MMGDLPIKIDTLVSDIYNLFLEPKDAIPDADVEDLGRAIAVCVRDRLSEHRDNPSLRLSNFGVPCDLSLWLKINHPEVIEPLKPETKMMFLIGDIVEHVLVFLAKQSGHEVTGQQGELEIGGIKGHRDCVIDGQLVDVKSASPFSFEKFSEHKLEGNDPFGYYLQLGGYLAASKDDPIVLDKSHASFLALNKVTGEITLDTHYYPGDPVLYEAIAHDIKEMVVGPRPPRSFSDQPHGKSGNRSLGTECRYCQVRASCWKDLRTFQYSNGPIYLTKVIKLPDVPEIFG